MKKINLKYIGLGIAFVLLVIGIPIMMDYFIIGNDISSNINNSDWVAFLGSYIGAVLGGIFTFIGIKITLYNSIEKKKQRDMLALQLKLTYKDVKSFVEGDSESKYPIHQFLIDKSWPDRVASIHSNISEKDFQNIYMWFSALDFLKTHQDEKGLVKASIIKTSFGGIIEDIPEMIDRLKNAKV